MGSKSTVTTALPRPRSNVGLRAEHEVVASGHFVEKILAGGGREFGREKPGLRDEIRDQRADAGDVVLLREVAGKKAVAI